MHGSIKFLGKDFRTLKIKGYSVKFPCRPYNSQIQFISAALDALSSNSCALLESPTGSGKSLAILAATLAYMEATRKLQKQTPSEGEKGPIRIYLATRTHSQISQLAKELKKFENVYSFKMTPLASRKHSCVNKLVRRRPNLNEECKTLVKRNGCVFFGKAGRLATSEALQRVHDIEDVLRVAIGDFENTSEVGKKSRGSGGIGGCPYYATRANLDTADFVLTPYQYLLDPSTRRSMGMRLKNCVVVFDEAHNIEGTCRDAVSKSFVITELQNAVIDLKKNQQSSETVVLSVLETFLGLCKDKLGKLLSVRKSKNKNTEKNEEILKREELKRLLAFCGLDRQSFREFLTACSIVTKQEDSNTNEKNVIAEEALLSNTLYTIDNFAAIVQTLFRNDKDIFADFICAITLPENSVHNPVTVTVEMGIVNFFCMNPAVAMSKLVKKASSILLISGTLSPTGTFASELGCQFPIKLSAPHVVDLKQYFVSSVSAAPPTLTSKERERLTGVYKITDKLSYQDGLACVIQKACNVLSQRLHEGGILIFVSSYALLGKLQRRWTANELLSGLKKKGVPIFFEPRGSADAFAVVLAKFRKSVTSGVAVMVAVCRGKASEGIDFADRMSRLVLLVGIPYAAIQDTLVKQKMIWNDFVHKSEGGYLAGRMWYELQAFRALNQAAGRCIRNQFDFGAILFVDSRFAGYDLRTNLSRWVAKNWRKEEGWEETWSSVGEFLVKAQIHVEKKRTVVEQLDIIE